MTAPSLGATIKATSRTMEGGTMTAKDEFDRQVRRTALLAVALVSALIFGIIVLAGADWIPGTLIVAASVIGLARLIPTINRLCRQTPPSPPHGKPTG